MALFITKIKKINKYKEKLNKEKKELYKNSKDGVLNINIKQYKRAEGEGFLTKIMPGWYFLNQPEGKNNTTIWQKDYYYFLSQYLEKHFGQDYVISADNSLKMYTKDTEIQKQIIVHTKNKNTNNLKNFENGYSLLIVHSSKNFDNINKAKNDYGLIIYALPDALLNITPVFFKNNPFEAELALKMVKNHQDFFIKDNSEFSSRIGKLIGAYKHIAMSNMAKRIEGSAQSFKIKPVITNPFENSYKSQIDTYKAENPAASRIKTKWKYYSEKIKQNIDISCLSQKNNFDELEKSIQNDFARDSYNSLSIEGYRITSEIIEAMKTNQGYENNIDALAAKGYRKAFDFNLSNIKDNFKKEEDIDLIYISGEIRTALFQPLVETKRINQEDILGFRKQQVFIKNAIHVPVNTKHISFCMETMEELAQKEDNPFIKAVLSHLFLVYIHPYDDGNGRTARLLMNNILSKDGLPWSIIEQDKKQEYFNCLEQACSGNDILPFANFILNTLKLEKSLKSNCKIN